MCQKKGGGRPLLASCLWFSLIDSVAFGIVSGRLSAIQSVSFRKQ